LHSELPWPFPYYFLLFAGLVSMIIEGTGTLQTRPFQIFLRPLFGKVSPPPVRCSPFNFFRSSRFAVDDSVACYEGDPYPLLLSEMQFPRDPRDIVRGFGHAIDVSSFRLSTVIVCRYFAMFSRFVLVRLRDAYTLFQTPKRSPQVSHSKYRSVADLGSFETPTSTLLVSFCGRFL